MRASWSSGGSPPSRKSIQRAERRGRVDSPGSLAEKAPPSWMDRSLMRPLSLHNSLTRRKERFEPLDPSHVRMYVCGPTVYDLAHIGNARANVVFDVLS